MDVIDWEKLSAKLGNRQPMVRKVLELVLQAHGDKGQQLLAALEQGDLAQIQTLIHALRGALANVETNTVLLEQAKLLELMAKAGEVRVLDLVPEFIQDAENCLQAIRDRLQIVP